MAKLDNKVALITGSSSGIGKAVALAFAREGAHLALNYPNDSQAQNAAEVKNTISTLGRRVIAVQADVSQDMAPCQAELVHGPLCNVQLW